MVRAERRPARFYRLTLRQLETGLSFQVEQDLKSRIPKQKRCKTGYCHVFFHLSALVRAERRLAALNWFEHPLGP